MGLGGVEGRLPATRFFRSAPRSADASRFRVLAGALRLWEEGVDWLDIAAELFRPLYRALRDSSSSDSSSLSDTSAELEALHMLAGSPSADAKYEQAIQLVVHGRADAWLNSHHYRDSDSDSDSRRDQTRRLFMAPYCAYVEYEKTG